MKFEIKYTDDAFDDLHGFRKYDQVIILDSVERQLRDQPMIETRNRKRLRPNGVADVGSVRFNPYGEGVAG